MKRDKISIDNIIRKSKVTNLKTLKEEIRIKKNLSLIRFLMQYLINIVEEIDYSNDPNELLENIRFLNYLKPENENERKILEHLIKELKEKINLKKSSLQNNSVIYNALNDFDEQISLFLIEIHFNKVNDEDKINVPKIDDKKLKRIVLDFVFKYKDYGHLKILISLYPNICNFKLNNKTLVIKMLKNFFEHPNEREFLSKVITIFITNTNYMISKNEKNEIALLCDKYISLLEISDLIFVKEVITSLDIRKELDYVQKLEALKARFNLKNSEIDSTKLSYEIYPQDLTNRKVITIDRADTLIRDDAFSIEKKKDGTYELGLYIIDCSSIKAGSELDRYAYNHFSTIYVKNTWIPMIPEPLVYSFSLNKGLRRVIAYTFTFAPNFDLIGCEIGPALINVSNNLTYSESGDILKNDGELYTFLKDAIDISEVMGDKLGTMTRYHHLKEIIRDLGGVFEETPEKYLDEPGNKIISTFAVYLNNYIASLFDKLKLPFIYRINGVTNSVGIETELRKYSQDKELYNMLKTVQCLYKVSEFSSINTGHKGLGLNAYTQATNPARLYPSLVIQRMIIDLLILKIPVEDYIKKYKQVANSAQEFTKLQQRNYSFTTEYNKLCKRLTLEER